MADSTTDLTTSRMDGDLIAYPVAASTAISKGVMAFIDGVTGYLTDTVADASGNIHFVGITHESCTSQDASGNAYIPCWRNGIFELALTGAALTDVGDAVYLVDNQTVTKTDTGSLIKIGTAAKYENADKIFVDIARR